MWSLSIEEIFYIGFPLACLLLRKDWVLAPALALLALSQPFALKSIVVNPIWREKAYLPGMAGIAAGVLAAIVASTSDARQAMAAHRSHRSRERAAFSPTSALKTTSFTGLDYWVIFLLTVSAACLVLGFHLQARAVPGWSIRGSGWLQSYGRLSYEIYLTHMFVILTVVRIFKMSHAGIRWGVLWYLPAIGLAWVLGWLVAKYFRSVRAGSGARG